MFILFLLPFLIQLIISQFNGVFIVEAFNQSNVSSPSSFIIERDSRTVWNWKTVLEYYFYRAGFHHSSADMQGSHSNPSDSDSMEINHSSDNSSAENQSNIRTVSCSIFSVNWWNVTRGKVLIVNASEYETHLVQVDSPSSRLWVDQERSSLLEAHRHQPKSAKSRAKLKKMAHRNETKKSPSGKDSVKKSVPIMCTVVFIYAEWCRFSMLAAPAVNALARLFPQLQFLAINVDEYWASKWNLHMFYIPKIKVHANRKIFREFNGTDSDLDQLVDFIVHTTGELPMFPSTSVVIRDEDHNAPSLSTNLVERPDYWLAISWIAVILAITNLTLRSARGQRFTEKLKLLWQEHQMNYN